MAKGSTAVVLRLWNSWYRRFFLSFVFAFGIHAMCDGLYWWDRGGLILDFGREGSFFEWGSHGNRHDQLRGGNELVLILTDSYKVGLIFIDLQSNILMVSPCYVPRCLEDHWCTAVPRRSLGSLPINGWWIHVGVGWIDENGSVIAKLILALKNILITMVDTCHFAR